MKFSVLHGISIQGVYGRSWKQFFSDLKNEIKNDNVINGAAALAYYLMLAIFPAMIFLLSLLPYLPISNLQQAVMDLLNQALPGEAAQIFTGTVQEIVSEKKGGLLSVGALATLWAASSGIYAIMQQLNITYDVKEGRNFIKVRGTALLLTLGFGALLIGSFALIVLGGAIQNWISDLFGSASVFVTLFSIARWVVIAFGLTLAFAQIYYFGPDVDQEFQFITPGSVFAVISLVLTSLVFKLYVENFGSYNATYGSLGAVIVLMLWLNITGLVLLLGSEINSLIEHYSPKGKQKGEKEEGEKESYHEYGKNSARAS